MYLLTEVAQRISPLILWGVVSFSFPVNFPAINFNSFIEMKPICKIWHLKLQGRKAPGDFSVNDMQYHPWVMGEGISKSCLVSSAFAMFFLEAS